MVRCGKFLIYSIKYCYDFEDAVIRDYHILPAAAKNTKKGVDSFVTGKGKTLSKVPNALPPVAPFSKESSIHIINYIKDKLNPNVTKHEDNNIQFQSMTKEQLLNVYMNQEFGLRHPNTTSAGKIDIIYLPPFPDVPKDKIGDFIRNKVKWYLGENG